MKNLGKKLIGWMICLSMAVAMLPGMARKAKAEEVIDENGIKYEKIADDMVIVKECNTEMVIVDIPSEVEGFKVVGIDANAFRGCESTRTVVISSNVSKIPERVFVDCNQLVSIQVNANNSDFASVDGVLFSKDKTRLICCPAGYKGHESSGECIIPESVKTIKSSAFYGCSNLTSITLPSGLTSIEDYTFYGCTGLKSIMLPSGLTSIGSSAFYGCSDLTSILLPNGLTEIGDNAFSGCYNLETVWLPAGKTNSFGNTSVFPRLSNVITYSVDNASFPTNLTYNGKNQAGAVKEKIILHGDTSLSEGKAYRVLFSCDSGKNWTSGCTDAGKYIVKLVVDNAAAGYVGEVTDASWIFSINKLDLSTVSVDIRDVEFIYDGKDQKDRIKDAFKTQLEGIGITFHDGDYTVEFSADSGAIWSTDVDVINAGSGYQVKILGVGKNCTGEREESFEIKPASLVSEGISFDFGNGDFIYDGDDLTSAITSALRVKFGEKELTVATDYSLEYFDSSSQPVSSVKNIGEYTVKITGKGNFTDSVTKSFEIKPSSGLTVSLENTSYEYDGTAKAIGNNPTTNAKGGTTTYTYSFEENGTYATDLSSLTKTNAGVYTVYVKATNPNYSNVATTTATLEITKKAITIKADSDSKEYDGTPLTNNSYTNTDLAPGDEIKTITITGSQTVTGNCDNISSAAVIENAAGVDVTECYDITYEDGMLSIEPAKATIKVDSASKTEGESDPAFTGTVEGLVKEGDLGTVSYKRTNSDEAPGAYKGVISATYTENPNYDVTVVNGDFTIAAKEKETYKAVSGAGGSYTQENSGTLTFSFKSTENDASTFDHFKGVEVDGKAVPEKDNSGRVNWTAKRGSVIIELQPAFLDTLSVGEHLIKVIFDDGESSAIFKILEAIATPTPTVDATPTVTPATDTTAAVTPSLDATPTVTPAADATPVTGDAANPFLWIAMILMSMAGVAVMIEKKRRKA